MAPNAFTLLSLIGMGVQPYSARGLQQTLDFIDQIVGQQRRTINGQLKDVSNAQFRRYKSTISGSDMQAPVCDGVWPGKAITVQCVAELAYAEGGTPQRPVVPGSSRTDQGFVFYRPQLQMIVLQLSQQEDEYGRVVSWTLELEEA